MRRKSLSVGFAAAGVGLMLALHAWAFPEVARQTKLVCATCHSNPAGGVELTEPGKAYKADATKVPAAGTAKAAEYVGSNKCKMCHLKQHKAWTETKHANAIASLKKIDDKAAADMAAKFKVELKGSAMQTAGCVSCHVTGYQLAGGYPAADSAKTAALTGVTCESCHGPGSLHVAAPLAEKKKFTNRAVTANMCTRCHTPVASPAFKFEEYVKRGGHVVPAAAPAPKTGG